jgi:hypothetical protein
VVKTYSIKRFFIIMICLVSLALGACSDNEVASDKEDNQLVLGKNGFIWNIQVKYSTNDPSALAIYANPITVESENELSTYWTRDKSGVSEPGKGILGFQTIVHGTKKGNTAELNGTFLIFNGSENGPNKMVNIKGSYPIIDDADIEHTPTYIIFTDEGFREVSQDEWNSYRP